VKAFALAVQSAGVDLTDASALDQFIERYNDELLAG
jgi:hypothetical protein